MGLLSVLPKHDRTGWPWSQETDPLLYGKQESWPKISIVTPSFNQADYLEETIRSVLLQNYPNLEYIVIDGGSTDGSVEILRKYAPWLTFWVSERDNGQSDAINKGLEHCTGDLFNWINSDDYYEPKAFYSLGKLFKKGFTKVVAGRLNLVTPTGEKQTLGVFPSVGTLREGLSESYYQQQSTFYDREAFQHIGGLRPDLHYVMDWDLWMRYLLCYGLEHIAIYQYTLANFRYHDQSKTQNSEGGKKFLNEQLGVFESLIQYKEKDVDKENENDNNHRLTDHMYSRLEVLNTLNTSEIKTAFNNFLFKEIQKRRRQNQNYAQTRFLLPLFYVSCFTPLQQREFAYLRFAHNIPSILYSIRYKLLYKFRLFLAR